MAAALKDPFLDAAGLSDGDRATASDAARTAPYGAGSSRSSLAGRMVAAVGEERMNRVYLLPQ
jgi:hypothetical protein